MATIQAREAEQFKALKQWIKSMRESSIERASNVEGEFKQAREAAQTKIIHDRRDRGHPTLGTRGVFVPKKPSVSVKGKTVQISWVRVHFDRTGKMCQRYIAKGPGTKYSIPAITQGTPYWARDLIRQAERKASLIRKHLRAVAALDRALHACERSVRVMQSANAGNADPLEWAVPVEQEDPLRDTGSRIAPEPRLLPKKDRNSDNPDR